MEALVLLALHVEHPVGDVINIFGRQSVFRLVWVGGEVLALAPDTVVASAVKCHRWWRKLVIVVELHGLTPISCPAFGNVIIIRAMSHLVTNCP